MVQEPRITRRDRDDKRTLIEMVDLMNNEERIEPKEESTMVQLGEDQKHYTYVGGVYLKI